MNEAPDDGNIVFFSLEPTSNSRERVSALDEVNDNVTRHFKDAPFHSVYLYPPTHTKGEFIASVLFSTDKDIGAWEKTGGRQDLADFVNAELGRAGFGQPDDINVHFKYDSDENINSEDRIRNIPSDEEFKRASRDMKEQSRNLDVVNENVVKRFEDVCPLDYFILMPQGGDEFLACVFFERDKDIQACRSNGIVQEIIDCVYAELDLAGRGRRPDISVRFEFDSFENVVANYEGDYFLRLR